MNRHAKPHKKKSRLWWIQAALIVVLLILILITLGRKHNDTPSHSNQVNINTIAEPTQYDFYSLLPSMHVTQPIPKPPVSQPLVPPSKEVSPIKRYYLQIGAFRKQTQAYNLLNLLEKQRLTATIQTKINLQNTFYRVMLGPYTYSKSKEVQRMLKKQYYNPLIIEDTSNQ